MSFASNKYFLNNENSANLSMIKIEKTDKEECNTYINH